ncbi:MAG TPA: hypothetical protein VK689_04910 [Armatimonadota bacterium]|nr:hypothetical protein [Armatimonadota bacterium]
MTRARNRTPSRLFSIMAALGLCLTAWSVVSGWWLGILMGTALLNGGLWQAGVWWAIERLLPTRPNRAVLMISLISAVSLGCSVLWITMFLRTTG